MLKAKWRRLRSEWVVLITCLWASWVIVARHWWVHQPLSLVFYLESLDWWRRRWCQNIYSNSAYLYLYYGPPHLCFSFTIFLNFMYMEWNGVEWRNLLPLLFLSSSFPPLSIIFVTCHVLSLASRFQNTIFISNASFHSPTHVGSHS